MYIFPLNTRIYIRGTSLRVLERKGYYVKLEITDSTIYCDKAYVIKNVTTLADTIKEETAKSKEGLTCTIFKFLCNILRKNLTKINIFSNNLSPKLS